MSSLKAQRYLFALAIFGLTACGDSTGPTDLDSTSAIHSLALGMQSYSNLGIGFPVPIDQSFDDFAPFLDRVSVNVDGAWQSMYALALRESFPPGTCAETIFGRSPGTPPDACTPPPFGLTLVLWQSHSASAPPDRIMVLAGDTGTICVLDCSGTISSQSGFAQYLQNELWTSQSGTSISSVTATTSACSTPLPYYAKSGNCSIAGFDIEVKITFGNFVDAKTMTMTFPRQTIHGLWIAISEVQPAQ